MTEKHRPNSEAHRLANEHVRDYEQFTLDFLAAKDVLANKAAQSKHDGGCGCKTCRAIAKRAHQEFVLENMRQHIWSPDQEEEWIMEWAINQYLVQEEE